MKKTSSTPHKTSRSRNIFDRIETYNRGRNPDLTQRKFEKMREDVFSFFRGTCHLFYEDWNLETSHIAPVVWCCGDLHTENFGSYKGENRLVYFDINDFDESILAPAFCDITRLVASVFVAADAYSLSVEEARNLASAYLSSYTAALHYGKAGAVERETADGIIGDLLHTVQDRTRKDFLKNRTESDNGKRRIIADGRRYLEVSKTVGKQVKEKIEDIGATLGKPDFFRVLDIKFRIAGTGSLGVRRYAALVEGNGSPHKHYILDVKEALPSSVLPYLQRFSPNKDSETNHLSNIQPAWSSEAQRVIEVQHRMQFSTPALLTTLDIGGTSYILRELQPTQDKLNLAALGGKYKRFAQTLATMGEITSFAQLRSSGRGGSATADELIAFAAKAAWKQDILRYAEQYAEQVHRDFEEFCAIKTK